jgi:rubrerythrin
VRRIGSPNELYAHAIAIEREAVERYSELAGLMDDRGDAAAAEVFATLAGFEAEHLESLRRRTEGVEVPDLRAGEYRWLDAGAPETAARELVFRLIGPREALQIALGAERRAQAFFEDAMLRAEDPALRALAREMSADEGEHILLIERLLERTPHGPEGQVLFGR